MKRNSNRSNLSIILLLTLIVSASCKDGVPIPQEETCVLPEIQRELASVEEEQGPSSDEEEEPARVCNLPEQDPEATLEINANFRDFEKFPADRKEKMLEAISRLKIVINSVDFREKIRDHIYNGSYTFVDNQDLTNEEIYEKIMDGAETLSDSLDNEMDIDITLYYKNNGTVGYTYPNTTRTWVNDKFLGTNTLGQVAANVAHEWTHKIGFNHDFNRTQRRDYSVPYGVGKVIRELVDQM